MYPIVLFLIIIIPLLLGAYIMYLAYFNKPLGRDEWAFLDTVTEKKYPGTKDWIKSNLENGVINDTFINSEEGWRLHAYIGKTHDSKRTAILIHGYSGCALQMMPYARHWFDDLGYNIMVIDLPNHGQSDGNKTFMGWKERLVLIEWIRRSQDFFPDTDVYLHGMSMGAATALMAAGDGLPTFVKGIVSDCSFSSVWDEIKHSFKNKHLPTIPVLYLSNIIAKIYFGWSYTEASVVNQVAKTTLPILFIHGDADQRVPVSQAYKLFKAKTIGKKQLWITKDAAHCSSLALYPERYTKNIKSFFE